MRAPEVYLSTEGFAVPYEDLWPFLNTSWESLKNLPLRHVGRTYLLVVQEFKLNGVRHVRRALLCMIDPEDYRIEDEGGVLRRTEPVDLLFEAEFYGVKTYLYTAKVNGSLPREMVIADGHHRYRAYSMEGEVFIAFMDVNDPALVILPTHRGLRVDRVLIKRLLRNGDLKKKVLRGVRDEHFNRFPVILKGRGARPIGLNFNVKDGPITEVPAHLSDNVFLGGQYERIAGYERYRRDLNMPRKSTDFFPKLVAGPTFVK